MVVRMRWSLPGPGQSCPVCTLNMICAFLGSIIKRTADLDSGALNGVLNGALNGVLNGSLNGVLNGVLNEVWSRGSSMQCSMHVHMAYFSA